jgi:phosphoserine phosphatase
MATGERAQPRGSFFYSDSHKALPLLELVDKPVVVDPDPTLLAHAGRAGSPILSVRGPARGTRGGEGARDDAPKPF